MGQSHIPTTSRRPVDRSSDVRTLQLARSSDEPSASLQHARNVRVRLLERRQLTGHTPASRFRPSATHRAVHRRQHARPSTGSDVLREHPVRHGWSTPQDRLRHWLGRPACHAFGQIRYRIHSRVAWPFRCCSTAGRRRTGRFLPACSVAVSVVGRRTERAARSSSASAVGGPRARVGRPAGILACTGSVTSGGVAARDGRSSDARRARSRGETIPDSAAA